VSGADYLQLIGVSLDLAGTLLIARGVLSAARWRDLPVKLARALVSPRRADLLASLSSMNSEQGGAVVRGTALLVLGFGFQAAAVLCD
jgi:hypothetical protein